MSYNTDNYNTFEEWFDLVLKNNEEVYPSLRIPYGEWVDDYIENIDSKSISEVKDLLRCLLQPITRRLDVSDYNQYQLLCESEDETLNIMAEKMSHNERYKRIAYGQDAWEGLTWVLELLPISPYSAVKALESYVYSQPNLPDDRITGIDQCVQIIFSKFIHIENKLDSLLNLKSVEFEWLVEHLYERMGYTTEWKSATHDGGKDIIASIDRSDGKEYVYVECKLFKTTKLKLETIRAFRDTILEDKVNRGVVFCTGYVSRSIREFDKRIQVWTYEDINVLLNAHLGSDWIDRLDRVIDLKRRQYGK